jgi:hypothetical protein
MAHEHLQAAIEHARRGDMAAAYEHARQELIESPGYVPAWLLMSRLVDDRRRKRECLERALALDPQCQAAHDGLADLRLADTLGTPWAPQYVAPYQLGNYLVDKGVITAEQLEQAVLEQRVHAAQGEERPRLGDTLVRLGILTPRALARAMMQQQEERLSPRTGWSISLIGEFLVAEGAITPQQLEDTLAEQIQQRSAGRPAPLGRLLLLHSYLSIATLQRALARQREESKGEQTRMID